MNSDDNFPQLPAHLDEEFIKDKGQDKVEKYFDIKKEKLVNNIRRISVIKFKNDIKRQAQFVEQAQEAIEQE